MRRRRSVLVAVVVLVALSGCASPFAVSDGSLDTDRELGYVDEYGYDDTFGLDGSETLSEDELEAVTYRAMARIEVLRGHKFERAVDVEIVDRDEYRDRDVRPAQPATNELWRGAFVVDGETDVNEAYDELYGDSIRGYYQDGTVALVVDDPDDARIDRTTLVHELVHALQDQRLALSVEGETLDERRAETGLIEGEADYLPTLYDDRCETEWECLEDVEPDPDDPDERPFNAGLFLSMYAPYSEGPAFVQHLHESGGWDAVDAAYEERPASTSQLIRPETYPDDRPLEVGVPDRSTDGWEPLTDSNGDQKHTVGEATLFATLWANGVIERPLEDGADDDSQYNYSHPITNGWGGDTFVAYRNGDRHGHVWRLAWESADDAERFAQAYRELLAAHDAEPVDDDNDVYRIADGDPFAGAYEISLEGDEVLIVGGPTVESLDAIHDGEQASTATPSLESPAASTAVAIGVPTESATAPP
ncbi:Hvo_1808 family surface protein [Natrialbaceae archaeon AArc-T1-2]|uniref:Hvo_1808 family surface protein n=1 Tax=Natrialbaceae archaeon AArc-T1-2 TaxID=3053904 RepID=UPI00255B1EDE|nr:Hvo_1808 family surface protein [Natrialbaceae archaeon AArc-T1-2]WIV68344.1 Hvo_1808 family surface protein [Natrialbaceae archaeon AArc-T1-2]